MIRRMCCLVLICTMLLAGGCKSSSVGVPSEDQVLQYAEEFMDLMVSGEFTRAKMYFDSNLDQALSSERMRENWERLVQQYGIFIRIKGTQLEKYNDYYIVYAECLFRKQAVEAKIVLNKSAQITGLFFTPVNLLPDVPKDSFIEAEVSIEGDDYYLPGVVTLPAEGNSFPGIVLVHNSSTNDRDGTLGPNKILRDLAWELAAQGIATLRYDKRCHVYPEYFINNYKYTAQEHVMDDAVQAVRYFSGYPQIDSNSMFLLGHGLGGTLSPYIAGQVSGIRGIILMAALARPVEEAILDQYQYVYGLSEEMSDEEMDLLKDVQAGVDRLKNIYQGEIGQPRTLVFGAPVSYWLDLNRYNPSERIHSNLDIPVLVLQGARDYQVTEADYRIWKENLDPARADFFYYEELNHMFMAGEGTITPAEYLIPANISRAVVDDIAAWVQWTSQEEAE